MAQKKTPREVVAAAALAVCGDKPRVITAEERRKINDRCVKLQIGRRSVGEWLVLLGYTSQKPARQHKKVKNLIARAFKDAQKIQDREQLRLHKEALIKALEEEAKKIGFPSPSWDHVTAIADDMAASPWPRIRGLPPGPVSEDELCKQVISFLMRARTEKEIRKKFGDTGMSHLAVLLKFPPDGFRMKEGHNEYREKTHYLEQIPGKHPVKPGKRVFKILHSKDDPDYVSVIFPKNLDFADSPRDNQLRILPIDTVWYGDHGCDLERFKEYLLYIASKPYVFAVLNGDIIGGSAYDKDTAVEKREELKQLLAPVAHKILWAQSGPLEKRMRKVDGVEPLANICEELGIFHTERPVRADVYWKFPTKPIEFYALHGRSQARKAGSKVNAIQDVVTDNNFPHFTILGHLQHGTTKGYTVRRIDPIQETIVEHTAYGIICPGFRVHRGSEGEKKGYPHPAMGTVGCWIDSNNGHHAGS